MDNRIGRPNAYLKQVIGEDSRDGREAIFKKSHFEFSKIEDEQKILH